MRASLPEHLSCLAPEILGCTVVVSQGLPVSFGPSMLRPVGVWTQQRLESTFFFFLKFHRGNSNGFSWSRFGPISALLSFLKSPGLSLTAPWWLVLHSAEGCALHACSDPL